MYDGNIVKLEFGACNWGVAKDIMDWVIDRDPEAGRYWRDDIGRGVDAYDALLHRIKHDLNAHAQVYYCRTRAIEYLRDRGFPVH